VEAALEARLTPPRLRSGAVARPRLLEQLHGLREVPVVLVVAPAGYGKTTLLTQYVAQDPRPCAWLSLEPAHDDPIALLTHVAYALGQVDDVGDDLFAALRAGPSAVVPVALPRLGRLFAGLTEPIVLVLDDAQYVTTQRAGDAIRALIDHLPDGSQLLLGSRSEPSWPHARLRAGGRMAVVDGPALQMTAQEGADLLRAAGVELGPEEASAVVRRTEGWAAALYLASLALREQPDREGVEFDGRDRSLVDYFREEVLISADDEQIAFLTRTAVLSRLTAPLCDAVLGRTDSAAMLERLAEANLFVTPLDRRGEWYRVHALFADSLLAELRRAEPELEQTLHRRAGAWHRTDGQLEQAVWHALQAGDVGAAADLVWLVTPVLQTQGQSGTLVRWLDWFTREQRARHPGLALTGMWVNMPLGQGDRFREWLAVAGSAPPDTVLVDGVPLEAHLAVARSAMCDDGARQMARDAARARAVMPERTVWFGLACYTAGTAQHAMGDLAAARADLEEADRQCSASAPTVQSLVLAQCALVAVDEERWADALLCMDRARARQREAGIEDYATQAIVFAADALVRAHEGDAEEARASARRSTALMALQHHFSVWGNVEARARLARAQLLLGDPVAARAVLPDAERDIARIPDAPRLRETLAAVRRMADDAGVTVPGGPSSLTTAEVRVLQYLPTHLSFREIGEHLFISRNTVKTHALSVYRKLDVSSRSEAVDRARAIGVLEGDGS
jgi:LuxR family maltose regulon positive regulatory protein